MTRRAIPLLINPASGGGRGRSFAERLGASSGLEIRITRGPEDLERVAREAVDRGLERLLVAGGDGTIRLVLPALDGAACALGIVPLGRGNDFARALGLPRQPLAAVRRALDGPIGTIDLGRAGDQRFATVAGIGFHGNVAGLAYRTRRVPASLVYPYAVLRALSRFAPTRVQIEEDGRRLDLRVTMVVAANLPFFGGGMRIAPDAAADDGQLDLVIVGALSRLRLLAAFPRVYRGRHRSHPAIRRRRVRRVTLRATPSLPVIADGETVARCDEAGTTLRVLPGALRIVR